MLKTIILMAGRGTRFLDLDPDKPKPLVELHGHPLIRWVVENLRVKTPQQYIFVALKEHIEKFQLNDLFNSWNIHFNLVEVDTVTKGAACSALFARKFMDEDQMLIVNSDQYIRFSADQFIADANQRGLDGSILTMKASGPKWSYVRVNEKEMVTEVKEKQEISETATVGVYYFRRGQDFVTATERMIAADDTVNGEFYIAPVYNYLIGSRISHYPVGVAGTEMIGLGTKEDFLKFQENPESLNEAKKLFA
jgi:dTDP-glucose pyrophosphorylase